MLLHIMARLCLCDAQVFGFIAAPCPQLGIFFEGIMSSCFKEREKTLCRGTERSTVKSLEAVFYHKTFFSLIIAIEIPAFKNN